MIKADEIYPIGYVAKTHGIKGELNVRLDTPYNPEDFRFAVFELDAIFVPFVIQDARGNGEANRLVTLEGVDTVDEARMFVGKNMYVLKCELSQHPDYEDIKSEEAESMYLSDLIGYVMVDTDGKKVGEITGFNDDTLNYLLEVKLPDGRNVFVPYVDEWVIDLDRDAKKIAMDLPNGILD